MRILITGGAGFVGSHLAEALLGAGHRRVRHRRSVDRLDRQHRLTSRRGRASHYKIDTVFNESLTAELVDAADVVFHLAAAVGVKLIVERPVHTIETNVHGTEVVLRHAGKKKKLVFIASTSEVYGKSTDVPFREDADLVLGATTRHRWAYACSKMLDEFLALAYWKETQAAGRRLPPVQHRRSAPDRAVRDGAAQLRPPGAGRRADHRVRRRHPEPQLHLRGRRRAGAAGADGRAGGRSARCSTSATSKR